MERSIYSLQDENARLRRDLANEKERYELCSQRLKCFKDVSACHDAFYEEIGSDCTDFDHLLELLNKIRSIKSELLKLDNTIVEKTANTQSALPIDFDSCPGMSRKNKSVPSEGSKKFPLYLMDYRKCNNLEDESSQLPRDDLDTISETTDVAPETMEQYYSPSATESCKLQQNNEDYFAPKSQRKRLNKPTSC